MINTKSSLCKPHNFLLFLGIILSLDNILLGVFVFLVRSNIRWRGLLVDRLFTFFLSGQESTAAGAFLIFETWALE